MAALAQHSDGADVGEFARRYYAGVGDEDLAAQPVDALAERALALWQLAHWRTHGTAIVNVEAPAHGHTAIDIVNDDMPFIVDSVTMALERHDLGIHLVVHPIAARAAHRGGRADRARIRRRVVARRGRRPPRVVGAHRGRPRDERSHARSGARRSATRAGRRTGRDERLDEDAVRVPPRLRPARGTPAADRRRRARRGPGTPHMARRSALHVSRVPRVRPPARRHLASRARHRSRLAARRARCPVGELCPAPPRDSRQGASSARCWC